MSGSGNRLLANENNGNLYFYHLDRLGSPIMITNKTGNVVKEKKYEAFGNMEEGHMPEEWKHGYSKGVAINKEKKEAIYWIEIW